MKVGQRGLASNTPSLYEAVMSLVLVPWGSPKLRLKEPYLRHRKHNRGATV